jgi:hypothetical protein
VRFLPLRLLFFILVFVFSAPAISADLRGEWILKFESESSHSIANLSIRFTNEAAISCVGDNWFNIDILSSTRENLEFLPGAGRLSYTMHGNTLTIGRNLECDSYLQLAGEMNDNEMHGNFFKSGWTTARLGAFSLTKKK